MLRFTRERDAARTDVRGVGFVARCLFGRLATRLAALAKLALSALGTEEQQIHPRRIDAPVVEHVLITLWRPAALLAG